MIRKIAIITLITVALLGVVELGLRVIGFTDAPQQELKSRFPGVQGNAVLHHNRFTQWDARPHARLKDMTPGSDTANDPNSYGDRRQAATTPPQTALLNPDDLLTNNLGMHLSPDATPKKPPGTFRVLCLGGSTTWGWTSQTSWPAELQRALQAAEPSRSIQVLNAGIPVYSTEHIRRKFEKTLANVEADAVVLMSSWNDCTQWQGADTETFVHWDRAVQQTESWSSLRLLQLARHLRSRARRPATPAAPTPAEPTADEQERRKGPRVSLTRYRENLLAIHELAVARGIRLVLCTEPSALSLLTGEPKKNRAAGGHTVARQQAYSDVLRTFAREKKLPLADPAAALTLEQQHLFFFEPEHDPVHPLPEGNRWIARQIAATLRNDPLLQLELADPEH